MKTCPKCGSAAVPEEPHKYPSTRIHFACDGYGYTDGGEFDLVYRSELCLEREEKNTLQRKVEELQVALDFANEAVGGDSCSRPMCVLRRERDAYKEALERISQASAHVMKMMRPFCENFSPPVRAAMTEILDIASKALEKKGSRGSDENAPDGLPAQVGASGAEEDVNSENELNRECGIIDLFVLHLRNIRDSSASADELRDYARALLVCHGLDKPKNAEGAGVSAENPASGEGVPMQSPEDGK